MPDGDSGNTDARAAARRPSEMLLLGISHSRLLVQWCELNRSAPARCDLGRRERQVAKIFLPFGQQSPSGHFSNGRPPFAIQLDRRAQAEM
jgi:hypothetical protein